MTNFDITIFERYSTKVKSIIDHEDIHNFSLVAILLVSAQHNNIRLG